MTAGIGGGGLPRVKEFLAYLKALYDTVITTGATKSGQVNLRAADGTELGAPGGVPLHVDVTGDFPDNVQGAVETGNADVDPLTPGHRVLPVKNGGHANAAAPAAVAENQIVDAWYDLSGRLHVALDDGSHVTVGAVADAAVAAGAAGTVSAKLRRITADIGELDALGKVAGDGIKADIVNILGTAPTTAGKLDVISEDGDLATVGTIADAVVAAGAAGTLSAKLRRIAADIGELDALGKVSGAGVKADIVNILGTAPTTAGKFDVISADGDLETVGAIADAVVDAGATGTLSAKLRRLTTDLDALNTLIASYIGIPGDAVPAGSAVIALNKSGVVIDAQADASGNLKVAPKTPPGPFSATGTGAIALTVNPAYDFYLQGVTLHLNSAPTTSEYLVITLNPTEGAAYSTVLYKSDLSSGSVTDLVFQTAVPLLCRSGDTVTVAYTNTDGKTFGVRAIVTSA